MSSPGGRDEFIHWLQDVRDQRGILRNYTKYDNEIRTGRNVKQLVLRALQIARSAPAGPVYLVGPREVMEEQVEPYVLEPGRYTPVAPMALAPEVTAEIATALAGARKPLVITSYLGSNPAAVGELVQLADTLAVPVIEASPNHVNFPDTHPMHHVLSLAHCGAEPAARRGRRHPGRRLRRAMDSGGEPPRR